MCIFTYCAIATNLVGPRQHGLIAYEQPMVPAGSIYVIRLYFSMGKGFEENGEKSEQQNQYQ